MTNGDVHVDVVSSDDVKEEPTSLNGNVTNCVEANLSSEEKKENALLKSQIKIMSEQLQKNQQMLVLM